MSKTEFYVDSNGKQYGGFGNGAKPPEGAVKVPEPQHGKDVWDVDHWIPYVPPILEDSPTVAALQAILDGDMVAAQEAINQLRENSE